MTPHHDYVSLIVRAADGALDAPERARLDDHVAACAECREALDTQIAVRALVVARPLQQASPDFVRRVRERLPVGKRAWLEAWDFRTWTWRLAPVAALLLLAAFGVARHAPVTSATSSGTASLTDVGSSATAASDASALWSSSRGLCRAW